MSQWRNEKLFPGFFYSFSKVVFSFPVFRLVSPKTPGIEWQKREGNKKEKTGLVSLCLFSFILPRETAARLHHIFLSAAQISHVHCLPITSSFSPLKTLFVQLERGLPHTQREKEKNTKFRSEPSPKTAPSGLKCHQTFNFSKMDF